MAGLLTLPAVAWTQGRSQPVSASDGWMTANVVGHWLAVVVAFVVAWRWLRTEGLKPQNRATLKRLRQRRWSGRARQ